MTTFRYSNIESARNFIYNAHKPSSLAIVKQGGKFVVTTNRHALELIKSGAEEVSLF
ncbi:hypothetical protein [Pontibacter beigongshangensis]|uniref:hypothetical protein n=1 Tax=Pontibacter beigongshangensis TaxID=2574733 RepID=UPI00164F7E6E|nr:hypothetical protein [Pontibacter beigongshangensis]